MHDCDRWATAAVLPEKEGVEGKGGPTKIGARCGRILGQTQQLMRARRHDLARLVTQENGQPFEVARHEASFAAGCFSRFVAEARRVYGALVPSPYQEKSIGD